MKIFQEYDYKKQFIYYVFCVFVLIYICKNGVLGIMQEFLKNKTINCSFMSLTGYRTLVLLEILLQGPKSTNEINEAFVNNPYIKEKFSSDTLRIYINSLRTIGCNITKANKTTNNKYVLLSQPFNLEISSKQLKAISKIYKNIYTELSIKDLILLENIFSKISLLIENKETKNSLKELSFLKNINKDLLLELASHTEKHNQIQFLYNSPNSGKKEINIIADRIGFRSEKLYIWGYSTYHKDYAYFRIDRIIEIQSISLRNEQTEVEDIKVQYRLRSKNDYNPLKDEKIISKYENTYIIEKTGKSRFSIVQDLLYKGNKCEVLTPEDIKSEILEKLKGMEAIYND